MENWITFDKTEMYLNAKINEKQAGAELGQAQRELGLEVWVGG